MRQIDQAEPLHPLGEPTNRKPAPELTPIAGRPTRRWHSSKSTKTKAPPSMMVRLSNRNPLP